MSGRGRTNGTGKLRDYAAKKPVAITSEGKFILPSEVSSGLGVVSLAALDTALQQKLVLERINLDPKYDLGIFDTGKFTKREVIKQVENLTDFGRVVITAELKYCTEFVARATASVEAHAVKLPKPKGPEIIIPPWKPPFRRVKIYLKNTALFCENTTDGTTAHAAQYRIAHVHPVFASRGFNVVSLEGVHDIRTEFVPAAKGSLVNYISGIGHGSADAYTGHLNLNNPPILQVGVYGPAEVQGKVIHLLSCQTAKQLGKDVAPKGAHGYAGYAENFTFVWDNPGTPTNEEELFWQCDSTFDIYMAQGYTVEQAHNATIAAYNAIIATVPNTSAATWLTWDRDYFRSPVIDPIYGDKLAKTPSVTAFWISIPFSVPELVSVVEKAAK